MDNFIAARSQMGMSLAFHIIFATIGVSFVDDDNLRMAVEVDRRSGPPLIVPPELTIYNSAAPRNIVSDLVIAVAMGALVLIPSLILLLLVCKTHRESISVDADITPV
jgi:hypothetical protein